MPEVLRVDGEVPAEACLARAAEVLAGGGLLIFPTDTLYALGGRALDPRAGARVRAGKQREAGKPLPLVAADTGQAAALASEWSPLARRLAARLWPGPLTLVLPARPGLPAEVRGDGQTVAVRVPALRLSRDLCARSGPLISTSANRSGEPPPNTCAEAVRAVGEAADLALDAGPGTGAPSTVVDLTGGSPRLLRAGALPWEAVLALEAEA
jgi:L-threonylcarbamoyladenylate synthase